MINEATSQYILQHDHDDIRTLALRGCKDPQVDLTLALQQIQGRQTARRKLPSWAAVDGIVYPPHLNMEQCSGELTARYKRDIAGGLPATAGGRSLLDLTGGLGVDFSFMADVFDEAVYVERDPHLCELAAHNLALLGKRNATVVCDDATHFLSARHPRPAVYPPRNTPHTLSEAPFCLIFLDPARRDTHGARTYALTDCTPDVTTMMDELLRHASHVLLKLSPMLDWRKAVADLAPHGVQEVHIVAVDNECKEMLLLLSHTTPATPRLVCTDIHSRDGSLTRYSPRLDVPPSRSFCSSPSTGGAGGGSFLFEPNAAIMKGGCFGQLSADFGIAQLAPNSHLFTSPTLVEGFPGRCFRINAVTTMNKRDLQSTLGHVKKANVAVRNFPLTAEMLRRRLKIADGGNDYIFATTQADGSHIVILCSKM